jgi:hypothetical protein
MPDPQGLDVHDIQVNHQTVIGAANVPQKSIIFTYSIGTHGPFTDSVPDTKDAGKDSAAMLTVIDNMVQLLRMVTQRQIAG